MRDTRTIMVGAARVTVLNAGDLYFRLADELAVPEAAWRPRHADVFDRRLPYPSQSIFVEHGGVKVLADVNDYRATVTPDSPYLEPGYTPPPAIPDQLAALGVRPENVTHVIITHAHWDHFAGTTHPAGAGYAPTFPNARHILGGADWEDAELQAALRDPSSLESRSLGVLRERGLLEPVAGVRALAEGIELRPTPGETPGHQIVRVSSRGRTLYALGDLFHDAVEVERPEWMVTWADRETMLATRRALIADALAEDALLVAAHIRGIGRLEQTDMGVRWAAAVV